MFLLSYFCFIQKKAATWCPQWTADETLCCLKSPNNEVNFYKDGDFSQVEKRLSISKMNAFSLSPGSRQHYPVVCFVPGQKGGAAFGKMFNYPALDPQQNAVAHRSFFQVNIFVPFMFAELSFFLIFVSFIFPNLLFFVF